MTTRLKGSVALITGGAGDIGRAVAVALVAEGAHPVIADLDYENANELVRSIRSSGGSATAVQVDLSDPLQCRTLVEQTIEDLGSLEVLVNCAAVTKRGTISDITQADWDRLVAINLSSVFWTCRAAVEHMDRVGAGVIVNIGSIAGLRGLPGSPAYAATKGGVVALSRALAIDHARAGVRIHSVNPPAVDTRLFRAMFEGGQEPEEDRRRFEASEGAGRVLRPEEIAELVAFLARGDGPIFSPEPLVT